MLIDYDNLYYISSLDSYYSIPLNLLKRSGEKQEIFLTKYRNYDTLLYWHLAKFSYYIQFGKFDDDGLKLNLQFYYATIHLNW